MEMQATSVDIADNVQDAVTQFATLVRMSARELQIALARADYADQVDVYEDTNPYFRLCRLCRSG